MLALWIVAKNRLHLFYFQFILYFELGLGSNVMSQTVTSSHTHVT